MRHFKYFLVILFLWVTDVLMAQDTLTPYMLSSFVDGTLYYSHAPERTAKLNYHLVGQEIVMDFNDSKVSVNKFPNLDSVRIGDRLFVLREGKSYELLHGGDIEFLANHRHTSHRAAEEGLYGTRAHTGGVVVVNKTVLPNDFYSEKWNKHYELANRLEYLVVRNGKVTEVNSIAKFSAVFKNKKKEIRKFASEHKINYFDTDQMLDLYLFSIEN